ncbi:hypothetical protein RJ639_000126 [Escallonia herrerae]|uniref:Sialyltransferase n=1 Tax=Escallonia herrerae TaxID=1293975 RepID=A0AA89BLS9_9ASTE|nr:hypothetical protein RJ639_000126 [Escallonia herrerae]
MKRRIRPLFSLLLVIVLAATLSLRVSVRAGTKPVPRVFSKGALPAFNATLLKFASVDAGEARLQQEIEQLVEGNFGNRGRHRSFLSSGKYRFDIRARSARGIPVSLRSPQFYRLWLDFKRHLQDWSQKRRYEPDIMSDMVDIVKDKIDRYNGVAKKGFEGRFKTCAVVGNSGILLNNENGKLIDGHEFVIRLNNARTGSFERHVGSKTSVSFVNSNILHLCARREGCFCHPYGAEVPMIMYICQPVHFLDYTLCNLSHKAPLLVTDPRFDVLCARIVKYYSVKRFLKDTGKGIEEWGSAHDGANFHYSSGIQAVMLALGICDKLSVFGFGKFASAKHHYHTNQKAELRLHDYEAEYDFYHDLVARPEVIPFISGKFKFPPVVIHQ